METLLDGLGLLQCVEEETVLEEYAGDAPQSEKDRINAANAAKVKNSKYAKLVIVKHIADSHLEYA